MHRFKAFCLRFFFIVSSSVHNIVSGTAQLWLSVNFERLWTFEINFVEIVNDEGTKFYQLLKLKGKLKMTERKHYYTARVKIIISTQVKSLDCNRKCYELKSEKY